MNSTETIHNENIAGLENLILGGVVEDIGIPAELSIQHFKSGGGNHLYLIEAENKKYLARVNFYPLKDGWEIKKHEYECLKMIEKLNIAPKAYFIDTSCKFLSHHFDIVDFIEGKEILNFNSEMINKIAHTLHKLHTSVIFSRAGNRFPPNNNLPYHCEVFNEFASGEDKQIEQYKNLKGIETVITPFNEKRQKLGKWFNGLELFKDCDHFCLCHADLKKENILESDRMIRLIDWECAGSDIPETDVGRLFSGCQFSKKQEDLFLKQYFGGRIDNVAVERIYSVKKVLDFFRILEDYLILKRNPWDANNMLDEIIQFDVPGD